MSKNITKYEIINHGDLVLLVGMKKNKKVFAKLLTKNDFVDIVFEKPICFVGFTKEELEYFMVQLGSERNQQIEEKYKTLDKIEEVKRIPIKYPHVVEGLILQKEKK